MRILITGGAGFIGSALVRHLLEEENYEIMNIDCLTYAGNLDSLKEAEKNPRYSFKKIDICEHSDVSRVINEFAPDKIMHLAAESHVDRSIDGPKEFIRTNIFGTFNLLNLSLDYYQKLDKSRKENFMFHHISTDEVFGDLIDKTSFFTEESPYDPSSPYSASKASSDHLVRAWNRTFNLPTLITNCSNNYGPFQFPEKLIPLVIIKALNGDPIPIYGDGLQIRDWLYVQDHVQALEKVILEGSVGETYNIGGNNEKTNLEVVSLICDNLEVLAPNKPPNVNLYKDLINFVEDRPGHDMRYAIDASKIKQNLGWVPHETFNSGLKKTIKWFLENKDWWEELI